MGATGCIDAVSSQEALRVAKPDWLIGIGLELT
jgi:hypothetical protein